MGSRYVDCKTCGESFPINSPAGLRWGLEGAAIDRRECPSCHALHVYTEDEYWTRSNQEETKPCRKS